MTGCCGACGGDGVDPSAWESNGMCWDCHGTGHPHVGRCRWRFLDWWHLKEGAVTWSALVWTLLTTAFGAPLLIGSAWVGLGAVLSVGPSLLAILGLIFLGRAADNQIKRCGLPPADEVMGTCRWCSIELSRWRVLLLRRYCSVCAPRMLGDAGIYGQAGGPPCSKGARAGQTERSHR